MAVQFAGRLTFVPSVAQGGRAEAISQQNLPTVGIDLSFNRIAYVRVSEPPIPDPERNSYF
jgi:hypothetical protein